MTFLLLHLGLQLAVADQARFHPWHTKPATPDFSLDQFEAKVHTTVGKLLFEDNFENRTLFSGVAGGNQFATIWVRDFCHATGGLLMKPSWKIGTKDVPSKTIVLSTLKEILSFVKGENGSSIQIPRALDSLGPHEDLLSFKVLKAGASLKAKVTFPFGNKDPGKGMEKFPSGKLYAYFNGEDGAKETSDAGYLLILTFTRVVPLLTDAELNEFLTSSGSNLQKAVDFYSSPHRWEQRDNKWFFNQTAWSEWKDSCKQEGISSYSNLQLVEALTKLIKLMKSNAAVATTLSGAKLFGPRFGSTQPMTLGNTSGYDGLLSQLHDWTMDIHAHFYDNATGLLRELDSHGNQELFKISHIDANLQWLETNDHSEEARQLISLDSISQAFVKRLHDNSGIRTLQGINAKGWPKSEVSPAKQVIGLYQYHGHFAWSWWTCWFAEIAAKESNATLAKDLLGFVWRTQYDSSLNQKFSGYISEVYTNTHIVNTMAYVSETPFLWGSSYCVRAVEALKHPQAALLQSNKEAKSPSKMRPRRWSLRSQGKLEQDEDSMALLQSEL